MTATVTAKNGQASAEGAESTPAQEVSALNIHQRKLAVMARVKAISHDKTHPAHGYTYNSIDNISDSIRELFVEYGIDYCPSTSPDGLAMTVELVNSDRPEDRITSTWPLVEGDKGFAYSTKFPLVRMFLVADGGKDDPDKTGEADESVMATNSGRPAQRRPTPPPARTTGTGAQPLGPCPECAEEGITAASGKPAAYWPPRKAGHLPQCNGYRDGVYMNHVMRVDSEAATAAIASSPDDDGRLPWD